MARPQKPSEDDATKVFGGHLAEDAELHVIEGEFVGRSIKLGAGTVIIGRSSECDFVLKAASGVSRRHCKVQYLGNRFVVVDLESRNGTIVNGVSVERKVLESGDRLEIGDEIVEFVIRGGARAPAAALEPIESLPTALLATPSPSAREELPETLPPQSARAPLRVPVLPPPLPPLPPPAEQRSNAGVYVGIVVGVGVLAGLSFLVWDTSMRPHTSDDTAVAVFDAGASAAAAVVDAGAVAPVVAVVAVVDAGVAVVAVVDAGAGVAVANAGAKVEVAAAVVDAGTPVAVVVDTGVAAAAVDAGDRSADAFVVRATLGGRIDEVMVHPGDAVTVDSPLVVVTVESFNVKKKLETLRSEEKDFLAVVDKNETAKEELAAIRAEIKRLEARLRPQTQKANRAGVVGEVIVKSGDVIRDGAPLLTLLKP